MEVLVVFFFLQWLMEKILVHQEMDWTSFMTTSYYHVCVQLLEKHQLDDFDRSSDAAFTTCIN